MECEFACGGFESLLGEDGCRACGYGGGEEGLGGEGSIRVGGEDWACRIGTCGGRDG